MESISNAATAAAKAVWGDGTAHKEPVSGAKGDVSKGEPYDAGNLEPARQEQVEKSLESRHVETAPDPYTREDTTFGQNDTRDPDKIPQNASKLNDVDTTTPGPASKPSAVLEGSYSRPSEGFDSRPAENATSNDRDVSRDKVPEAHPLEPKSLEPKSLESTSLESKSLESKPLESKPLESKPLEPKPLDSRPLETTTSTSSVEKSEPEESKGTGQEYVRTTGLAADGGDFDATKPGAGREADRLMEEKGIHHNEDGSRPDSGKDKPSLGHRIKAKLHKH
ncbi:hypothetical protein G7Z17_g13260 [Cylindrodendrum hubeiense]|uniref:Uncharacterized protein n=1 Tax=Cylindrodendrum hubeiense TaxID=595255 RepID=A0A9P5H1D3_9HYPO|nr:hypothetical protein G7Z17_g13260 [Cylindrodendrum hubeiense]